MSALQDEWEKVAGWLVPPDASPIQRQEMRLAFYIGVATTIRLHIAMAHSNLSDADGGNEIKKWMNEINDVVSRIMEERCRRIH